MTDILGVSTTIHAPQADVYAFLRDVEGYAGYSDYIERVARRGNGDPGTEYAITLAWWRLAYTARVRLTALDPPDRIAWWLVEGLDARGTWTLEPTDSDDPDVDHSTRVTLTVRYDPDSADEGAVSRPPLVPMSAIVERVRPFVEREGERVLGRVVADLEGAPRQATLVIDIRRDVE